MAGVRTSWRRRAYEAFLLVGVAVFVGTFLVVAYRDIATDNLERRLGGVWQIEPAQSRFKLAGGGAIYLEFADYSSIKRYDQQRTLLMPRWSYYATTPSTVCFYESFPEPPETVCELYQTEFDQDRLMLTNEQGRYMLIKFPDQASFPH